VLVVLLLSFLASAIYAAITFTYDLTHIADPTKAPVVVRYVPPEFDPYGYVRQLVGVGLQLVPVALVAHLLARARSSMQSLGFDLRRPKHDLVWGAGLALLAHGAALAASAAARALDLPFRPIFAINSDAHFAALILIFASSATAAIAEEVIVNAYLITRLERLGWRPSRALLASAVLRGTYHLYQGIGGFIFNLVGGLVAGRIFQRTRRVMPIVVAHFLIDVIGYLVSYYLSDRYSFLRWG
jgi:membrane protease YdiL (CAAX protease family)